jgi:hypothetical protein
MAEATAGPTLRLEPSQLSKEARAAAMAGDNWPASRRARSVGSIFRSRDRTANCCRVRLEMTLPRHQRAATFFFLVVFAVICSTR